MKRRRFLQTMFTGPSLISMSCSRSDMLDEVTSPTSSAIALINGTFIDGSGTEATTGVDLVISNGIISYVGPLDTIDLPMDTRVINLEGCTIMPGFMNTHVHHGFDKRNLSVWASSGVTTVRDVGVNMSYQPFALRDTLLTGPTCARLTAAGPMLTVPGGYPEIPWGSAIGQPVTSPADARTQTLAVLEAGSEVIKIAIESGISFGRSIPFLSPDEARAIVETAHEYGSRVSAHVLAAADLSRAIDAGVDDIAHMISDYLTDDLIERMIEADIYWVPTLELWHCVGHNLGSTAINNLSRFVHAGGKVALGTDFDGYFCEFELGMPLKEIKWMSQAGMTPLQIIVAVTGAAAYVSNIDEKVGTLEVGKAADVLVVEGDPLTDLDTLLNVKMVIHDGVIIRES